MSASSSGAATAAQLAPPAAKTRGFLHIARHGVGPGAMYVLTYHRLDAEGPKPRPVLAEGAQSLIELLERIGVDFSLQESRGALEDILRFGSANIPDLWLSDEEILQKGLAET
ncbi:MAG TPA: hypothetical protein VGI16_12780 [Candidatus Acidoferrum sp.]|jgi:hypothetical protein